MSDLQYCAARKTKTFGSYEQVNIVAKSYARSAQGPSTTPLIPQSGWVWVRIRVRLVRVCLYMGVFVSEGDVKEEGTAVTVPLEHQRNKERAHPVS
jgi:hypothetical protein